MWNGAPQGPCRPADTDESTAILGRKARKRLPGNAPLNQDQNAVRNRRRVPETGGTAGRLVRPGPSLRTGPCTPRRRDPESQGNWLVLGARSEAVKSRCAEKRHEPSGISARRSVVLRRGSAGPLRGRESESGRSCCRDPERTCHWLRPGQATCVWSAVETAKGEWNLNTQWFFRSKHIIQRMREREREKVLTSILDQSSYLYPLFFGRYIE